MKGKKLKANFKGNGKKRVITEDSLDKELEGYWIKKGEKGTVSNHLDSELDEYWKGDGKLVKPNNDATRVSNSVDTSMLINMNDVHTKDLTGASPHYQSGLNLISN